MKNLLFSFFILIICFNGFSQDTNIVNVDTIQKHSVYRATILSTIIPGAGQIYNHMAMPKGKKKAFWKLPIIYAGLGYTGYSLIYNQITAASFKTEYKNRQNGGQLNADYAVYDDDALITLYRQYLDLRDASIFGFGGMYLLQIADAHIEAHFCNFDISDDISFQLRPSIVAGAIPGISLTFHFN